VDRIKCKHVIATITVINAILSIYLNLEKLKLTDQQFILKFGLMFTLIISGSLWAYLAWKDNKKVMDSKMTELKSYYDNKLEAINKSYYDKLFELEKKYRITHGVNITNYQKKYSDLLADVTLLRQTIQKQSVDKANDKKAPLP